MKKVFIILLSVALVVVVSVPAFAAEPTEEAQNIMMPSISWIQSKILENDSNATPETLSEYKYYWIYRDWMQSQSRYYGYYLVISQSPMIPYYGIDYDKSTIEFAPEIMGKGATYIFRCPEGENWEYLSHPNAWQYARRHMAAPMANNVGGINFITSNIYYTNYDMLLPDGSVFFWHPITLQEAVSNGLMNLVMDFGKTCGALLAVGLVVLGSLLLPGLVRRLTMYFV